MDINVNEKKVRVMADKLRTAVGPEHVTQGKALETLAQIFGFKNWDTLSGVLKKGKKQPQVPLLEGEVELFLPCHSTSEWGEYPDFCKRTLTQGYLDQLLRQRQLCKEHELTECRTYSGPQWGCDDEDKGNFVRVEYSELVVDENDFYYVGRVKHADYHVETRSCDIDKLLRTLKTRTNSSDGYLVWHEGRLIYAPDGDSASFIDSLKDLGEL